ncbi:hypothetical protein [Alicyclobacillus sendaiensis]|nr:hypothetical protein [Alicyclobacillus sendaiensis]
MKLWYVTDGETCGYVVARTVVEALQVAANGIVDEEMDWPYTEIVIQRVPDEDLITLCDEGEEPVTKRAVDWVREQTETPCVIGVEEQ